MPIPAAWRWPDPWVLSFVTLTLVFGVGFGLAIPPMHVPDEPTHFFSSYNVSEGQLVPTGRGHQRGGVVPRWTRRVYNGFSRALFNIPNWKPQPTIVGTRFAEVERVGAGRAFTGFNWVYPPTAYLPQAAALTVTRALGAPRWVQFYGGRFANLLLWSVVVGFAIAVTPVLKEALWLLGLTPMALSLAASYSADAAAMGVAWLFTACVLRLALDESVRPGTGWMWALCLLAALLALTKYAYSPLALLVFVIPRTRWRTAAVRAASRPAVVSVAILSLSCWLALAGVMRVGPVPGDATRASSWSTLLADPMAVVEAVFRATRFGWEFYAESMIGQLGLLDTPLAPWVISSFWCALIGAALVGAPTGARLSSVQRAWLMGVGVVIYGLIQVVAVLSWSDDLTTPAGFQGRYLLPLAPSVLATFCVPRFAPSVAERRWIHVALVVGVSAALYASLGTVLERYYGPAVADSSTAGVLVDIVRGLCG